MRVTERHCFVQENKKPKNLGIWKNKNRRLIKPRTEILFERAEWAPYQKSQSSDTVPSPLPSHREKLTAKCPGIFYGAYRSGRSRALAHTLAISSQGLKPSPRFIFATTFSGKKTHLCPIWGNWTQQLKAWVLLNVDSLLKHSASKFRPALHKSPAVSSVCQRTGNIQSLGVLFKKHIFVPHMTVSYFRWGSPFDLEVTHWRPLSTALGTPISLCGCPVRK